MVKALRNDLGVTRYGFAVGKRLGGAVVRNRLRRLLREGVWRIPVDSGWDIVIVARSSAVMADYHQLRDAMQALLGRAHLLKEG